ncbi:RICIN domain-containing protein [Streptomyces sp. NPDC059009]|uniref:RICIN domain-containing protein n=1 Tax=Streptomyces sp. NPDC059009 TaxID=3346694 RepID=UPI0036D1128D
MKSSKYSRSPRGVLAALMALVTVALALVTAGPAAAAGGDAAEGPLTALPKSVYGNFHLKIDRTKDYDAYGAAIRGVEQSGAVQKVTPASVALSRQHAGRPLCHTTGINGTFQYNGFCWDETDSTTNSYSTKGGWRPQGLTASHDAQPGGTVDGHHLYVASWLYGDAEAQDRFGRISILNSTGKDRSYGHVLLVEPTGSGSGADFKPVTNVHTDGMVWYGNKLFVANGNELQVYDFQNLWKMGASSGLTGIHDGVSTARWHQWALPMVGRYQIEPGKDARYCPAEPSDSRPCLGSLSLDRSGGVDHLVSGEYYKADTGPVARVARWPLNPATALPRADNGDTVGSTTSTGGFKAPVRQLQGVATDGTYYYLSAQCPNGYMGDSDPTDKHSYSCIYQAKPGQVPTVLTRSPSLTQNLSYAPSSGRLWGINEDIGNNVVFSLKPRAADHSVYLRNSYSALCAGGANKIGNGAPVIQWGCTNTRDERWVFENTKDANGKTAYFVRNEYSGKCMGVGSQLGNSAKVIQYTCNGAVDEKWWYDDGTKTLRNVYSGKCLAIGSTATKGTQLIQYTCNGKPDESWEKVPR